MRTPSSRSPFPAWSALLAAAFCVIGAVTALAQVPVPGRGGASLAGIVPIDRVIAIVNDEALTQYDVNEQKRVVLGQMRAQSVTPPAPCPPWRRRRLLPAAACRSPASSRSTG